MKQKQYEPMSTAEMAFSLFAANEGYLDDIDPSDVVTFEAAMQSFIKSSYSELVASINESTDYNSNVESSMRDALDDFKKNQSW